jgi:glycosyltransferase involved in cell wall biosynthesis
MRPSVVIRSKDEADRLRLVLTSLAVQTEPAEVVVVNDGSRDHTMDVLAEAAADLDLRVVPHAEPQGRSSAANAGAEHATGDVLIFLDGDTMAAPDFVARHMAIHRHHPNRIARGETWHLRCTRMLRDPESGSAMPGQEAKVGGWSDAERARSLVTRQQIREDFASIDRRAQPGIYPGFGPRRLFELEMQALVEDEDCSVLWAAASGSNQSVARSAFLDAGGFHPDLSINEHRELALRLCNAGMTMAACTGRSYHLTHRSGWRDPLEIPDWEAIFYAAHPVAEVALLPILWESLSETTRLPQASRLFTLPELAAAAARLEGGIGCEAVREAHIALTARARDAA